MKIIPSEKIKLTTHLTREEIVSILKKDTNEQIKGFKTDFFDRNDFNEYEGFIKNDKFEIQRIRHTKNTFSPLIKGTIYKTNGKNIIQLDLEIRPIHLFIVLMFLAAIVMTFLAMFAGIFSQGFNPIYCLVPLIIFFIIIGNMNSVFNTELEMILDDFTVKFEGTIEENF